ncbi:hypothetical protein B0H12DRAFT_808901 [Mycena haematopus]|nr:hypothetical protein B0H12DRAFT_808901 [Mycena haematopus]
MRAAQGPYPSSRRSLRAAASSFWAMQCIVSSELLFGSRCYLSTDNSSPRSCTRTLSRSKTSLLSRRYSLTCTTAPVSRSFWVPVQPSHQPSAYSAIHTEAEAWPTPVAFVIPLLSLQ